MVVIISVMSAIASWISSIGSQDSVSGPHRMPYQTPDAEVLIPTNAIAFSLYDNAGIRPILNLSPDAKDPFDDPREIRPYICTSQIVMDKGL